MNKKIISNLILATASTYLVGCAALGYFDETKFIAAVNAKQCQEAAYLLSAPMTGDLDRLEYQGIYELNCGNKDKGQKFLTEAARLGSSYARRTLVRHGLPLPDPKAPAPYVGGGADQRIDVYIHR